MQIKRPGRFLNVLCMFKLRPVSTGLMVAKTKIFNNFTVGNFAIDGFSTP